MKTLHLIFALSLLLAGGLNANERISSEYATVASKPGYRPVLKSQGEGSPDGSYFDDVANISTIVNINTIGIMSMYQVDLLEITYILNNGSLYLASDHGSSLFYPENITLDKDEYVSKIEGSTSNELVNQLTFTISSMNRKSKREIGPFGTTVGKENFTFEGFIIGFHGRTGKYVIQNVGVYYISPAKVSPYFGYPDSHNFMEDPDAFYPPVVKVTKIFICYSDRIDSIQLEYRLHGGRRMLGKQYPQGSTSGKLTTIIFRDNEWLIGAYGKVKQGRFQSYIEITFVTRKTDGSRALYGPYGSYNGTVQSTTKFSVTGTIIGYKGYFKNGLNSVGFFYY